MRQSRAAESALHCRFDQLHNAQPNDLGSSPFTAATLETLQRRCDVYEAQMDAHAREREEHLRALAERDERIVSAAVLLRSARLHHLCTQQRCGALGCASV